MNKFFFSLFSVLYSWIFFLFYDHTFNLSFPKSHINNLLSSLQTIFYEILEFNRIKLTTFIGSINLIHKKKKKLKINIFKILNRLFANFNKNLFLFFLFKKKKKENFFFL
jgi:hypothetical protein